MSDEEARRPLVAVERGMVRLRRSMSRRTLGALAIRGVEPAFDPAHFSVVDAVEEGGSQAAAEPGEGGEAGEVTVGLVGERLAVDPSRASRLVAAAIKAERPARVRPPAHPVRRGHGPARGLRSAGRGARHEVASTVTTRGIPFVVLPHRLGGKKERMAKREGRAKGMMARRARRLVKRLAIITVLIPLAAWALEEAARRSDSRDQASPWGQRLRHGSEWIGGFGRGPLANRLRRPPS